jgi:hypothetical protein
MSKLPPDILPPLGFKRREEQAFKDALMVAFHRLGGIEFLVAFGRNHPAEFVRTCARLIPLEVRGMAATQVHIIHAVAPTELDMHPDENGVLRMPEIPLALPLENEDEDV